jgi:signal transduction histidine kinase
MSMHVAERTEARRLAALHEYGLLDTPADPELEAVIRVAAAIAEVPTASLNLLDSDRQCMITTVGFAGADSPRRESMCEIGLALGGFVHVPDATVDGRFARNPWVTGVRGHMRFYAAAPLVSPRGHTLGTLCVFDDVPRQLSTDQMSRLSDLAAVVIALFERRRQARHQQHLREQAESARRDLDGAHQELAVQIQFLDAVLDSIDVAVVATDAEGHLTLFNRAARGWHGMDADPTVPASEMASHYHLYEADGSTLMSEARLPLLRALRNGAVNGAELIIAPHDRPTVTALASGRALVGPDGTRLGAVVAMSDVTQARAAQRQLLKLNTDLVMRTAQLDASVAELERSNGELRSLAAVASHDLLAPLSVIAAYLEELAEEYGAQLDEQAHRWLTIMRGATRRMRELMQSVLAYAEAGSAKLRAEPTMLDHVMEQVTEDLRGRVEEAGAELVAGGLPVVYGDPVALRQLLQNLVDNALKFARPDRPVRVECTAERGGDGWVIAVADNGRGIPAARRTEVFAMFARSYPESSREGAAQGHGIGLATCERIVSRHGGVIWAEDTPGGGTTIRFSLPDPAPDRVTTA